MLVCNAESHQLLCRHRGAEGEGSGDGETDLATQHAEGQDNADEAETGQEDTDSQLPVNTLFYGVRGQQVCPACYKSGEGLG